jgi:hypothetical protein
MLHYFTLIRKRGTYDVQHDLLLYDCYYGTIRTVSIEIPVLPANVIAPPFLLFVTILVRIVGWVSTQRLETVLSQEGWMLSSSLMVVRWVVVCAGRMDVNLVLWLTHPTPCARRALIASFRCIVNKASIS